MPRIDPNSLESFVTNLVHELGVSRGDAGDIAASLVAADLCGHSSHGVRQIPSKYVPEIAEGKIDPAADPVIEREDAGSALIDGRWAFGQVVGRMAVDAGVEKASEHGVGVVGLKNTSHIGRVGEWAERAAAEDMALVAFVCNPGSQYVAPAGSADRRLSTNPIAIGLPTFDALDFDLVLDIATSQVAHGKIKQRATEGTPLPEEWVIDASGESLTDGARFEDGGEGAMVPLGGTIAGYKGFGLSVMTELLAANVSDGFVSGQSDTAWGNHAAFQVLDLTRFTTREAVRERVLAFREYLDETTFSSDIPTGAGAKGENAMLPGEPEYRTARRHRDEGIPFSEEDVALLRELAVDNGLADAFSDAFK